jgi:WD40 repeat protein
MCFSPDGKSLLSGGMDNTVRLWDVSTGKERRQFKEPRKTLGVAVAFSPDGTLVAATGTEPPSTLSALPEPRLHKVSLWDVQADEPVRQLKASQSMISSVAFSSDGKVLAATGSSLATKADFDFRDAIVLWDVATGKELRRFPGVPANRKWEIHRQVRGVAFSPDDKTLASAESDSTVALYEVATGKLRHKLSGHHSDARAVAFTRDGALLVSTSFDGTALVWDLSGRALGVRRNAELTPKELDNLWTDLAGDDAAKAYRAVLTLAESPRQAVELLRQRVRPETASVDRLRTLRALEVLERIGTPEARQVLGTLSKGAPGAWLTGQGKASLDRLKKRDGAQ